MPSIHISCRCSSASQKMLSKQKVPYSDTSLIGNRRDGLIVLRILLHTCKLRRSYVIVPDLLHAIMTTDLQFIHEKTQSFLSHE